MNSPPPMTRIELIHGSVSCFVLGLFSLLPVIGLPFAMVALARGWSIRRRSRGLWNPAERYLKWSGNCASWGAALSTITAITLGLLVALASKG